MKSNFPISSSAGFLYVYFRQVTIFESFRFLMYKGRYKAGLVGNFKKAFLKLQHENHTHSYKTTLKINGGGEAPGFSEGSALLLTCSMASMIGINRVIFSK